MGHKCIFKYIVTINLPSKAILMLDNPFFRPSVELYQLGKMIHYFFMPHARAILLPKDPGCIELLKKDTVYIF